MVPPSAHQLPCITNNYCRLTGCRWDGAHIGAKSELEGKVWFMRGV